MPINTINISAAVNISAIGIAGTFLGMPIEALILGAVGVAGYFMAQTWKIWQMQRKMRKAA